MTFYVGLLRAINVGGIGKLAMSDLCSLCERTGLKRAKTYIQSGKVVFESPLAEAAVKTLLGASRGRADQRTNLMLIAFRQSL